MVVIVGTGHVAYGLGISRRISDELAAAGRPGLPVATFCPVIAPPPPDPDDDPAGHPMGGRSQGMGAVPPASPATFTRTLADFVGVFPDAGGVEAYPQLGLQLAEGEGVPTVSMVFPDSLAAAAGLASGDRILDVDGIRVANRSELRAQLAAIEWRRRLGFLIERGEQRQEVAVLLYPQVDLSEPETAPGWSIAPAVDFDPEADAPVAPAVGGPRPRSVVVSRAGVPQWLEVRSGDTLDEAHEVDGDGRVTRSVYRTPRPDGTVEVRYRRAGDGSVVSTVGLDRTGREVGR